MSRPREGLTPQVLRGAWRAAPPAPDLSADELGRVAPHLLRTGAGALGFWKVRNSPLAQSEPAQRLREAYLYHAIANARLELKVEQSFSLLEAAGAEPLLVKGWAAARHFAEPGLRPFGDVDLCVPPGLARRAAEALREKDDLRGLVDLHEGLAKLDREPLDELYARSQRVRLGETEVRVPGPEDHLRLLCVHMLRHENHKSAWLCDIAAILEAAGPGFDWDVCLGRDRRRAGWVIGVVHLAHRLLGAHVDEAFLLATRRHVPAWLLPAFTRHLDSTPSRYRAQMGVTWRRPALVVEYFRQFWPDPVLATAKMDGSFGGAPRLPYQIAAFATQIGRLAATVLPNFRGKRTR